MDREFEIIITMRIESELDFDNPGYYNTGERYFRVKEKDGELDDMGMFDLLAVPLLKLNGLLKRKNGTRFHVDNYIRTVKRRFAWEEVKGVVGLGVHFVPWLRERLGILFFRGENLRLLPAEEWVDPFWRHDRFLQAAIMDKEYTDWQNTYDPAIYELAGRPHQHLPRQKQPRPFDHLIDTSHNPGHWSYQGEYIDMIGSRMWLGGAFWKVVGEKKREELLASTMFAIDRLPNDVVRVEYGEPFIDESTADAQKELRRLLY